MNRECILLSVVIFCLFVFFCEYLIYFLVICQCSWPALHEKRINSTMKETNNELRIMLIADTHLLGPRRGHWFDKLRREWQMYRAFQTALSTHDPEVIFVLGDLFDEGEYSNDKQFSDYMNRFTSLFEIPKSKRMYVVPGNHDLGFHYKMRYDLFVKFNQEFKTSSVQFKNLKGNYFVFINSMAMHGDDCYFCQEAQYEIHKIGSKLDCLKTKKSCDHLTKLKRYTRPIVLQHFPMYRLSDAMCNDTDAAPKNIKNDIFRQQWECLSKDASEMIYDLLNPRVIFTGHTHHGCTVKHRTDIFEYTIPSFNWRNKNNPTFMLGVFTPDNYAVNKCEIPQESTVIIIYVTTIIAAVIFLVIYVYIRNTGLRKYKI